MAQVTIDKVKARTASLRKKLSEKGATLDGTAQRKAKKTIRRLQRKRRRLEVEVKRRAGKAASEAKEA